MRIDRKNLESNLPKKGFVKEKQHHHIYFHHMVDGKPTGAYTLISHTKKFQDITGDLIKKIRKQLKLDTSKQLEELVNCPMTGDDYLSHLRSKGVLS